MPTDPGNPFPSVEPGAPAGTSHRPGGRRLPVSTSGGHEPHRPSVLGDVVGGPVLPASPDHPEPGPGQDAYGVGVRAPPVDGPPVDVGGPRRGVAGVVGEVDDGLAELLVAGPP